jgi:predicted RNA binding protein YcfA (HicA-like mRNA interferase family)
MLVKPELNRAKIVARLKSDGWISEGGTKHEKFSHTKSARVKIMVPRHVTVTFGVAYSIAKAAGW